MKICKWVLLCFLAGMLLFPGFSVPVSAEDARTERTEMKLAAENEDFRLYYDTETADIALENKANGYIWHTSYPEGSSPATQLMTDELRSSVVLTCGNKSNGSQTKLRSVTSAELQITELQNGISVIYDFVQYGVRIPVTYVLEEDYLSVSTDTAAITESGNDQIAVQLTMLKGFGAGEPEEEGYFVLPDGCGALVHFHNGKTSTKSYSAKVYGRDITAVPNTKPAVTENIYLPVYGIVRENNAMAVIIENGSGNAFLNCSVSGQSQSDSDLCYFSFQLRGTDTYTLAGNDGASLTVFENGSIKNGKITLRYYPVSGEAADYAGIAEVYRNYLLADGGVSKKTEADTIELYLSLYGGCLKSRSVLGIPVTMKTAVTSYSKAQEIISSLSDNGVDKMTVIYKNWTDAGISGKIDYKAKPSRTLGGRKAFDALTACLEEKGFAFYPSVNNQVFRSGNGYFEFSDTAVRISGAYSRQMQYLLSYGVQDTSEKTASLLSPAAFTEMFRKLSGQYAAKGLNGVSPVGMTSNVWGDYGRQQMGCDDAIAALQESYQILQETGLSVLADTCAAYALPYADRIYDVPLQSSGFDLFDEEIPFYQMVLHGVIPYAGTAVNANADSAGTLLDSVAMGCCPAYDMIGTEASTLKDTALDRYYYANAAFWTEKAAREYRFASDILSGVSDQIMTDYVRDGDISVTTYENGTEIRVDHASQTVSVDGTLFRLSDYEEGA